MDNIFNDPRVREIQKNMEARLSGVLAPGKIQLGLLRVFRPMSANDKTLAFNLSDKNKVLPEIEMLMPDDRITIVFSQSIGVYAVPVTGTGTTRVEQVANGKYICSPHSGVFTANEVKSLVPFFGARLKFETDQTTRYDAMSVSMFQTLHQTSAEINYGMKHVILPTYFPVVGGKANTITATMPVSSVLTDIAGTATSQNYACMELGVMYLVGADAAAVLAALFG